MSGAKQMTEKWPDPELDEFERERSKLEAAIAVAKARAAAARDMLQTREATVKAALRADVIAAQDDVAAMERDHQRRVAEVREQARIEAAGIVATARRTADDLLLGVTSPGSERE
mgnify:FL=1